MTPRPPSRTAWALRIGAVALIAGAVLAACDAASPGANGPAGRGGEAHHGAPRLVQDPSAVGPRGPRSHDVRPEPDGPPNTLETLLTDMRLPSDSAWAHPGYSGVDGVPLDWQSRMQVPDIGTLAELDRLAGRNGFASDFHQRVDAIAPSFVVAEGVGNRSVNTQVLVRRLRVHALYDDGRWVPLPAPQRPTGQINRIVRGEWGYGVQDELPRDSTVRQRRIDTTITASRPAAPYFSETGFQATLPQPARIKGFWVAAQARLGLLDPAGPDDRDEAVYLANLWWDLYDADGQARRMPRTLAGGVPGHAIDGGLSRLKKVTRHWQWFNLVSVEGVEPPLLSAPWAFPEWKTVSPARAHCLTEAALREHPPPLR